MSPGQVSSKVWVSRLYTKIFNNYEWCIPVPLPADWDPIQFSLGLTTPVVAGSSLLGLRSGTWVSLSCCYELYTSNINTRENGQPVILTWDSTVSLYRLHVRISSLPTMAHEKIFHASITVLPLGPTHLLGGPCTVQIATTRNNSSTSTYWGHLHVHNTSLLDAKQWCVYSTVMCSIQVPANVLYARTCDLVVAQYQSGDIVKRNCNRESAQMNLWPWI